MSHFFILITLLSLLGLRTVPHHSEEGKCLSKSNMPGVL
jgi:hypothetical protein